VHKQVPWRSYQTCLEDLRRIPTHDEDAYIRGVLQTDVSKMAFANIVEWTRHFGREREREKEEAGMVDLLEPDALAFSDEEKRLIAFFKAVPGPSINRLHTLYYFGRDFDEDPPGMHDYLQGESDDAYRITLLRKKPLDEFLGRGLMILYRLRVDPEVDWHVHAPETMNDEDPRDFVADPPVTFHFRDPRAAAMDELLDALSHQRWTPLVSADDAEGGPYSSCITIRYEFVPGWIERGYRELSDCEVEEVRVTTRRRAGLPPIERERGFWSSGRHSRPSSTSRAAVPTAFPPARIETSSSTPTDNSNE